MKKKEKLKGMKTETKKEKQRKKGKRKNIKNRRET